MQTIWVDLLCWSSAWKLWRLCRTNDIRQVFFVNRVVSFIPFIPLLQKIIRKPVRQVDWIVEGETRFQGMSLYEWIHRRLNEILEQWTLEEHTSQFIERLCGSQKFNPDKFRAHLRGAAYAALCRPVALSAWASSSGKDNILLLRSSPFKDVMRKNFTKQRIYFYPFFVLRTSNIDDRPAYIYDKYLNKDYFASRTSTLGRFIGHWLMNIMAGILKAFLKQPNQDAHFSIGVELTQHRVRLDEINDISWLDDFGPDLKHVCTLQMERFDAASIKNVDAKGLVRFRISHHPFMLLKRLLKPSTSDGSQIIAVDRLFGLKTLPLILSLFKNWLNWNERAWLEFQGKKYISRTAFWASIYRQLGIKLLWTMYDVDEDKLTKGQAIELLGGLYTGGHWSNFPMYKIDGEKCFDVLFTWGEHFIRNNFNQYPFHAIFLIGYMCDYYFEAHRQRANDLRERYPKKFILSYHDNIMGNDLPYSKGMQIEIHKMLVSILRKFDHVAIFLKPKRKYVLDDILKAVPELNDFIKEGRIEVFTGETHRTKAVSAEIGMASDLVVGMGISTTATESFLAGTVAFHADLTGFERNEFGNRGAGVVVFRDIFNLEKAIIDRITKRNKQPYNEYRGYYTTLDPFQDGWAVRRMGFVIRKLNHYLNQGVPADEILHKVSHDYDSYLLSLPQLKSMSWN